MGIQLLFYLIAVTMNTIINFYNVKRNDCGYEPLHKNKKTIRHTL